MYDAIIVGARAAGSLLGPRGASADATHLVVADTGNHRVLVFDRANGGEATLVLGQSTFADASPNRGGAANAATLDAPEGVYTDGTRLIVTTTDLDQQTPAVVSALVAAGARVLEVRPEIPALEDVYLHLMEDRP